MRIRIQHRTRYEYEEPAALGPHQVRLRPAAHTRAKILDYSLSVSPECLVRWQQDPWGNRIARLTFPAERGVDHLELVVDASLDVRPINPFDFFLDDRCETVPFDYPDGLDTELGSARTPPFIGPGLARLLEALPLEGYVVDHLARIAREVAGRIRYIIREESGVQTTEETLSQAAGSCRDSAILLVDILRAQGFAARFVSGYLIQLTDEGIVPGEIRGVDRDVLDLHAWAEVFVPGAGWIGLDGTSGLFTSEGHIPLACTVHHDLAAPVSGTSDRQATRFSYLMDVARLGHEPRPRKPYTADQWRGILEAGRRADAALEERGLTLTMGGEPTFASREHPLEPEWNTAALGPTKWRQGLRLAGELRRRLPPGSMMMGRMGKQYPGESLPRWVLHIFWRRDGVPIWRRPDRLAPAGDGAGATMPVEEVERFGRELAGLLEIPPRLVPGYEDPWQALRLESQLPVDVDPLASAPDPGTAGTPEDRRRLARILDRGLGRIVGFALPVQRWQGRWITDDWPFRRGRMFLVPGDSPMGLRLPLDRLPVVPLPVSEVDPAAIAPRLEFDPREQTRRQIAAPADSGIRHQAPSAHGVRTAICLEPRPGALHIFLPPVPAAEDALELIALVEEVATRLDVQVHIEGYPPPVDPRLESCLVTPDPGVLEVNIPAASTFAGHVDLLELVADAANHAGLTTTKFQLDGRAAGSGGGNHLTLGGVTPAASPFLSHPHLLASLLRYLQVHPSLSYLFTGFFVGPTSQAPRIDEARLESLRELELALAQVPAPGSRVSPWVIDRLLRNLLVDVAGNTHRTEVSIDKLFDPAGPSGRLGLVELRAFEMPPHERMAAVQMLLVRSLIARFAREPCTARLIPWGHALHDRFMLPWFLWSDLQDILKDLLRHGLGLDPEWFRPFLDHRFPVMGVLTLEGLELELRMALEPWPTLGEEPTGATTSRYVDSSLERLQVRVTGLDSDRHQVLANGFLVPLAPTGRSGERVAGIRFRAWQPPHCLQPALPVDHPLRFDVVDTWARRSVGGCAYHVWHPEGRAFDTPPLTEFEAAARRAQRFTTEGHASWPVTPRVPAEHPDHPLTLDLRWTRIG